MHSDHTHYPCAVHRRRAPLGVYASETVIGKKNLSVSASFLPESDVVAISVTVKPSLLPFSVKCVLGYALCVY